jgi:hypothetical protein
MTVKTHTLNVRGQQVRTRTPRRFIACGVRPEAFTTEDGTYVAFAEVIFRSDNLAKALDLARRYRRDTRHLGDTITAVVIDTATGEEV